MAGRDFQPAGARRDDAVAGRAGLWSGGRARPALCPGCGARILLASAALDGPVPRYRYPLDPLIALFAAGGVTVAGAWALARGAGLAGRRERREQPRRAGLGGPRRRGQPVSAALRRCGASPMPSAWRSCCWWRWCSSSGSRFGSRRSSPRTARRTSCPAYDLVHSGEFELGLRRTPAYPSSWPARWCCSGTTCAASCCAAPARHRDGRAGVLCSGGCGRRDDGRPGSPVFWRG